MTTEYDWWNGAVEAAGIGDEKLTEYFRSHPIHEGEPQSGRYKLGNKNKTTNEVTFIPVAYWREKGMLHCRIGDQMATEQRALELWTYVLKRPISNDLYRIVIDHGLENGRWVWPSESPAAAMARSNNAPEDDSFEGISSAIEALVIEAKRLIKAGGAKDKVTADQAADLAERLQKLHTKADNARKVEKQPHFTKAQEVDDKWRPVTSSAMMYSQIKPTVIQPFLNEVKRQNEQKEREAREAIDKANSEAQAAQDAIDEAHRAGDTTMLATAQKQAAVAEAKVEQTQQVAAAAAPTPVRVGTRGRGVALRTTKAAKINDWNKATLALVNHPDIRAEVQRIATASAKIGVAIDGTEIVDVEGAV